MADRASVAPWHSAPFHPQNHGKNERFNRTLKAEAAGESARSTISARLSVPSTLGGIATTITVRTMRSTWRCRPIAIGPAHDSSAERRAL